jgi:competence protein ComEC
MLLPADIEANDEQALISRAAPQLRSSVLLVPHHGGKGSSTPEFINTVAAPNVVFSVGYRNAFRHPRPEVLERYAGSGQWRTDQQGAISVVLTDSANAPTMLSVWRQEHPRYWFGQ